MDETIEFRISQIEAEVAILKAALHQLTEYEERDLAEIQKRMREAREIAELL